jgi:phenylalanyl-tRNA synthetase beta chain
VLGEVHPDVAEGTEVVGAAVVAILDAEALIELVAATGPAQVRGLPRFPAVLRDLALIVDETVLAGELIAAFTAASRGLVERVELFDVFRGPQLGAGKKSLMLRVAYRDPEATLTDARIQTVCDEAVRAVNAALGAELRT